MIKTFTKTLIILLHKLFCIICTLKPCIKQRCFLRIGRPTGSLIGVLVVLI